MLYAFEKGNIKGCIQRKIGGNFLRSQLKITKQRDGMDDYSEYAGVFNSGDDDQLLSRPPSSSFTFATPFAAATRLKKNFSGR